MSRYVVIKLGGHALEGSNSFEAALDSLALDLMAMDHDGAHCVVVHGAGPQIDTVLDTLGIAITTIDGLRVTDDQTMDVVAMVLGHVNMRLVAGLNQRGVHAVGVAGPDGSFLRASLMGPSWGRVGSQIQVAPFILEDHARRSIVSVVNPVAVDGEGHLLNCNADAVAGAIASSLQAEALIILSDVDQIRLDPNDPGSAVATLTREEAIELLATGAVRDGMVPKVNAALEALAAGAARVVVANGSRERSMVGVLRREGLYTEVTV